jgi:hypothetical protein
MGGFARGADVGSVFKLEFSIGDAILSFELMTFVFLWWVGAPEKF